MQEKNIVPVMLADSVETVPQKSRLALFTRLLSFCFTIFRPSQIKQRNFKQICSIKRIFVIEDNRLTQVFFIRNMNKEKQMNLIIIIHKKHTA